MATVRLNAQPRDRSGKGAARSLRREGRVPAVIYGHGREPQALSVATREIERILGQISAASTVIELDLDGSTSRTLIREIQRHPVKRTLIHIDFQEVVAGELVTVKIPVVLHGVPEGVRLGSGMLDQVMYELHIQADPSSIPASVEADVTPLQIAQVLHVRDLSLPEGVVVLDDESLTVCTVQPPRVSEETAEEPTGGEPELIRKAKEEEEA
ncbi:MAG TPA: 50S ribosomal protein L25/general stress protein Ctc [Gemmatimonadales bacterium]